MAPLINLATLLSATLLCVTLLLAFATLWLNPSKHRISVHPDFHVGVEGRDLDVRLVFFNDAEHGPYSQSTSIIVVDSEGHPISPLHAAGIGDAWGIYYRYSRWSHATLWTLKVSLWYPAALFAVLPSIWLIRRWRSRGS